VSTFDVDLFVIGGGSGGVRAARIAAGHGARVMLAEEYRVGGTCVIRGCVPKKLYVYASRFVDAFEEARGFGYGLREAEFDFAALKGAKDREVARLEAVYRANLERAGVRLVDQRAVVDAPQAVRLADGTRVTAKVILLATGARPLYPPRLQGISLVDSSNDVFEWTSLPSSLLIAGGGYIGVEFACLLARLGSKVTLVVRHEHVLPRFDQDVRIALTQAMEHAGIQVLKNTEVIGVEGKPGDLKVTLRDGSGIAAQKVVMATGRAPNTSDLGLQAVGVELDRVGAVVVDPLSQSSVASIYAVGDITNRANLTPVAIREGQAFAESVFGGQSIRVDHELIPTAVFSTPEIGAIGLSEADARASYPEIVIYQTQFRPMKATLSGRPERSLMKLVVDGRTDRVLGVHIMGEAAGEMIQCLGIAMRMGATKADFDATMAVHPTAAEELVTLRSPFVAPPA
jgi:glutathione reductase (NADPH)